jgi:hypothetical protein
VNWNELILQCCERVGPGFWAEPFNAVSNVAFLIAAGFALALWRRSGSRDLPALLLILVAFSVGIGSFLFHTFAVRWAWLADVVPIGLFIAGYLVLALMRFLDLGLFGAILSLAVFEALSVGAIRAFPPEFLNRAAGYLPAIAGLVLIGGLLMARQYGDGRSPRCAPERDRATGRALFLAAGLFALSLAFRVVDLPICPAFPTGSHFVWHLLNALVLYVLLRAAIIHAGKAPAT